MSPAASIPICWRSGRIPDPFVADNEKRVQWVAESDWEYHRVFTVDPIVLTHDKVYLVCDGLDTLADVYLNDQLIAHTDNMFRQYRWDVKSMLRSGENELRVVFHSPVVYVTAQEKIREMPGVGDFRIIRRFAVAQSQLPLRLGLGHAVARHRYLARHSPRSVFARSP